MATTIPNRLTVLTLGARDQRRLADFYRGLGWEAVLDEGDFTLFRLRGALLAVFPLESLAEDAHATAASPDRGLRGFTLAINVDERDDVDAVIEAVRERGGRISKEPEDSHLFVGRSSYFADPEDNYWEVVWLPADRPVSRAVRAARGD